MKPVVLDASVFIAAVGPEDCFHEDSRRLRSWKWPAPCPAGYFERNAGFPSWNGCTLCGCGSAEDM